MERKLRYAWWFVLAVLILAAVWKLFLPHTSGAYLQKSAAGREIVVYVAGAIEQPGLVHLAPDARLDDALKQVQLLPEADLENLNLAERLKDGQKISVPNKSLNSPSSEGSAQPESLTKDESLRKGGSSSSSGSSSNKININTADASELDKLSGVGPALAERIIQYRKEHGPFAQPEDLQNVSGIGTKTYEKMASQVTVSP